jgi:hypothetical protein
MSLVKEDTEEDVGITIKVKQFKNVWNFYNSN